MNDAERFLRDYSRAVLDYTAGMFLGAGTSMSAGYPSWKGLLKDVADELRLELHDLEDLAAVAQWSIQKHNSKRTRISQAIVDQITPEKPIPPALKVIARLPVRSVWTTNYDKLIERAFGEISRPYDLKATQAQLAMKGAVPGAVKIYKMHGTIDDVKSLVIATEDYELYRQSRGAFLNLLEAQMMSSTFLFVGVSLTDPNIRHVLAAIRHSFPDVPPQSFLIAKSPDRAEFKSEDEYEARRMRHEYWVADLERYGFEVVEVPTYGAIDDLLLALERRVAMGRAWVSGSWVESEPSVPAEPASELAEALGQLVAKRGLTLVTGSGLTVGPASLRGFLDGLQRSGAWDLERRLIVRPFPQPPAGLAPNLEQWKQLREEMARLSGTMIIVGGVKRASGGQIEIAGGVFDEFERALAHQCFILPIGSSGGAAREIAARLVGSDIEAMGPKAQRPTDDTLTKLLDEDSPSAIIEIVDKLLSSRKVGNHG